MVPSPSRFSSTHTAIALRQSSEVADRNARLLAVSISREMFIRLVASIQECKAFSFGISGTSSAAAGSLPHLLAGDCASPHRCLHSNAELPLEDLDLEDLSHVDSMLALSNGPYHYLILAYRLKPTQGFMTALRLLLSCG